MPTKKVRQGPTESATKFSVGTKKRGNDGNMWQIISTTSGTRRWMKVGKKQEIVSIDTSMAGIFSLYLQRLEVFLSWR